MRLAKAELRIKELEAQVAELESALAQREHESELLATALQPPKGRPSLGMAGKPRGRPAKDSTALSSAERKRAERARKQGST